MIINAVFVQVWDENTENCHHLVVSCKVDMETKEVFNIDDFSVVGMKKLSREYIMVEDKKYPVSEDKNKTEFWYLK